MIERLQQTAIGRARAIVSVWAVLVLALLVAGSLTSSQLSPVRLIVPGSESDRAEQLFEERLGDLESDVAVALEGPAPVLDRRGRALATRLGRLDVSVLSPWGEDAAGAQLRPTPSQAVIAVRFTRATDEGRRAMEDRIARLTEQANSDPLTATVSGPGFIGRALEDSALDAVHRAELIALPILLLVLLVVFRSPLAAAVPLIFGVGAVIAANGIVALLSGLVELNLFAVTLAAMMGLALGVDYSLLLVSRFREEVAASSTGDVKAAALATSRTAGRTVVFAGLALATAMLAGLLVAPGGVLFSAVAGALVATLTSATSAALVGPSVLVLTGGRLGHRRGEPTGESARSPRWMAVVGAATARPGPAAAVLILSLFLIALPALRIETGPPDPSQLPQDDPARAGYEAVSDTIGAGWTSPFFAIIAADGAPSKSQERALGAWAERVEADPEVAALAVTGSEDRSALRATIVPRGGPNDAGTLALHDRLLGTAERLERSRVEVAVGGQPAEFADFRSALADRAPLLVAAIVLATGVALLLVFRSLILPIVAIVLNLLAVAAAFGALSLLFGGSAPLGGPGFIDAVSLVGAFTVVFGLSIDYYVFLIARMREEYLRCGDHGQAILRGLSSTGIVVTGAATIMVAVFSAFALADMAAIRQLGAALSIAVALDATLVRLFLLPAVMRLLGERVWSMWPASPVFARPQPSA